MLGIYWQLWNWLWDFYEYNYYNKSKVSYNVYVPVVVEESVKNLLNTVSLKDFIYKIEYCDYYED